MPEVYTKENIKYHQTHTGNPGVWNGRAKLCEQDVVNIRTRVKNGEDLHHIYEDYKNKLTWGSFYNTARGYNWKSIKV